MRSKDCLAHRTVGYIDVGDGKARADRKAMADLFTGSMALVNLIAIALLAPIALAVLRDYSRQRQAGQNPDFYASSVRGMKNAECWDEFDRVR